MEKENHHDRDDILSQWKLRYEEPLNEALFKQLDPLFATPSGETWAEVRKLLARETESAASKLLADISELDLYPEKSNQMVQDLRDCGRHVVERKAREEAVKVKQRMHVRFASILSNALIIKRKNRRKATKVAGIECLKLLSVMVAIRLDEKPIKIDNKVFSFNEKLDKYDESTGSAFNTEKHNKIEDKFFQLQSKDTILGKIVNKLISTSKEVKRDKVIESVLISSLIDDKTSLKNALASSTWPEVSPKDTLITPVECRMIWENFLAEILPQAQSFTEGLEAAKIGQGSVITSALNVVGTTLAGGG